MVLHSWDGGRVLITGVCGTIGRDLLRQVAATNAAEVIGLDNNETELFFLKEDYQHRDDVHLYLCDVRDRNELARRMVGVDIVLHAAALKHVILCEEAPRDAVQTNVIGTQNVIDAAIACRVKRVLFTSSDKAVNPTNVMGTSKLMAERLVTAANKRFGDDGPIFSSTRFGNVLGSRGSVIPLFKRQIAAGGPVTLTDTSMTRFIMTQAQAARLVMDSVFLAKGGEVFVTKMPVARIVDLAQVMIELLAPTYGHPASDIAVKTVGSRPGEKMYEELMNQEEVRRTLELDRYFIVCPAFYYVYRAVEYDYPGVISRQVNRAYNSSVERPLGKEQLTDFLVTNKLLDDEN